MNYIYSTFTAFNGTRVDNYDGETNADWQRLNSDSFPNTVKITNNKAHHTGENDNISNPYGPVNRPSEVFISEYEIPKASYVVEALFYNLGVFSEFLVDPPNPSIGNYIHPNGTITRLSDGYRRMNSFSRISARCTDGQLHGYTITYNQLDATFTLNKFEDNVVTKTYTYFDIIDPSDFRKVQLVVRGYWVEMWIDDIKRAYFIDEDEDAFLTAGYVNLWFNVDQHDDAPDEFSTKGMHTDNFRVHDEFPEFNLDASIDLDGFGNSEGEVSLFWTE